MLEAAKMAMASRLLHGNLDNLTETDVKMILPEDITAPVLTDNPTVHHPIGFV